MQDDLFGSNPSKIIRNTQSFDEPEVQEKSSLFDSIQITLSFDKLVISGISLVVLFAVTFALGVEKGKHKLAEYDLNNFAPTEQTQMIEQEWTSDNTAEVQTGITPQEGAAIEVNPKTPELLSAESTDKAEVAVEAKIDKSSLYRPVELISSNPQFIIQLVTYVTDSAAERTATSLAKKGYDAFVKKSGKYFVLNVGPFQGKNDAKAVLTQLRKDLSLKNDGFVRSLVR